MARTIKIVSVEDAAASPSGCGSEGSQSSQAQTQKFAAGIDTDIFEADLPEVGGERFWEAFWRTQHTYGGLSEGQALADVLKLLDDVVFAKLHEDIQRVVSDASALPEEDTNDILGMVSFLLCMERADPHYEPFDGGGYAEAIGRFSAVVDAETQRRHG